MALDPPWTSYLEEASWSLANPSLVCLTIDQYPQGSCLLGMEDQTMVNKHYPIYFIAAGFKLSLLLFVCATVHVFVHLSKHIFLLSPF